MISHITGDMEKMDFPGWGLLLVFLLGKGALHCV
jgi:hypothetical protein